MKPNIVLGITSSISCYKVIELIKKLKKKYDIDVIVSKNVLNLVDKKEYEEVLGKEVFVELFNPKFNYKKYLKENKKIKHISLADKASLYLIVPATANVIGKIANGIADDLLTSSVMATKADVVFCPAMNVKMWENDIVQENVQKLQRLGYHFVDPEEGELACGYHGVGRLADLDKIGFFIDNLIKKRSDFVGKKVIVTAGGTIEEIDPVRVITNKSSGKMGVYIAEEFRRRGADVTLLLGKADIKPKYGIKVVNVSSVNDLYSNLKKIIKKNDIIVHAAAVSDYYLKNKKNKKIKTKNDLSLELQQTTKILEKIKKLNKKIFLVGFKAEYNLSEKELIGRAFDKLKKAKCNLIVANDVGKYRVFGSDMNQVVIIDKNKKIKKTRLINKESIASIILDEIKRRL